MDKLEVTVLITNWNGKRLILPCIRDVLQAAALYAGPVEILVIDDASTDDSVAEIRRQYPEVRVVVNTVNQGVGGAINTGFAAARYRHVILLNNDCYLRGDYITPILDTLLRHNPRQVFAVMSRVYENDRETPGGGLSRAYIHNGLLRVRWATEEHYLLKEHYTFYATSGAVFDRDKWLALGGMDPRFKPFYSEDVDISYRAWKRAWKIIYQPRSELIHNQGTTIKSNFSKRLIRYSSQKNRFIFFYKNINDFIFCLNHWLAITFRMIEFLVKGEFGVMRVIFGMWFTYDSFRVWKKTDDGFRRMTDRDILAITSTWFTARETEHA